METYLAFCGNCGSPRRPGLRFCETCGSPVTPIPEACPRCGAMMRPDARFCGVCGQPVAASSGATPGSPAPIPPPPPVIVSSVNPGLAAGPETACSGDPPEASGPLDESWAEDKSDEEIGEEAYRRQEALEDARLVRGSQPPQLLPLSPEDRRTLQWKRAKLMAGVAFAGLICAVIVVLVLLMLTSPVNSEANRPAIILFSLALGGFGLIPGRGVVIGCRDAARVSDDLSEGCKETFRARVTSVCWHAYGRQRRRYARRIVQTPWSRRLVDYYIELKRVGTAGVAEERFAIPRRLYLELEKGDLIHAEVARHSRVLLSTAK